MCRARSSCRVRTSCRCWGWRPKNLSSAAPKNLRRLAGLLRGQDLSDLSLPESFRAKLRPYRLKVWPGSICCARAAWAGCSLTIWGSAKPCKSWRCWRWRRHRGNLAQPALIVAPTSLMTNWLNEAQKFAPDLRVLVLHGADRKQNFAAISEHDFVLTTYPLIARDREVLLSRDWHMAVLDEAQTIKNPAAATTRWSRDVKAQHRFCLTGTPMENHLGELWSILTFATRALSATRPLSRASGAFRSRSTAIRSARGRWHSGSDRSCCAGPRSRSRPNCRQERDRRAHRAGRQSARPLRSIRMSMSAQVRKAIAQRGLARSHIIVLEALLKMRQACCDPRS